jgi:hypothetical protein
MSKVFDNNKNITRNFDNIKSGDNDDLSNEDNINSNNNLPLSTKLIFAIAGAPYQMFFSAISVFSTVFLLEVANLPPAKTS